MQNGRYCTKGLKRKPNTRDGKCTFPKLSSFAPAEYHVHKEVRPDKLLIGIKSAMGFRQ